ncbi:MAG TPA: carbohydrate porin [Verrucomicrobiae bacterium]|nr:carbohydrate porin [Verrucomicrobiae bacterium]
MRECDAEPADWYQTRSWGVFGNFGISDGEPNPIEWSAILGIGGSSPIPGRKQDTFGLAYYYLIIGVPIAYSANCFQVLVRLCQKCRS